MNHSYVMQYLSELFHHNKQVFTSYSTQDLNLCELAKMFTQSRFLVSLRRSEMFQGDKGGAGTAAFIHTKPENSLSEFISRNPQLFHQVQAAASSMQDNVTL